MIHLAEHLIQYRKARHLTQAEVADFLGVTKASVSKWETGQTVPDVALLPVIASFYNVSLDELMGYEPQLSRKQIQMAYEKFAQRFSEEDFDAVYKDICSMVRRYYSCHPFLVQMAVLLLNHSIRLTDPSKLDKVRNDMLALCDEVAARTEDPILLENARMIKNTVLLQKGEYEAVIEHLEHLTNPNWPDDQASILTQAYLAKGESKAADRTLQISMYKHLLMMIQQSIQRMMLQAGNKEALYQTIKRTDALMAAYDVAHLHPNTASIYHYQVAVLLAQEREADQAQIMQRLEQYIEAAGILFKDDLKIHGDGYFPCITEWFKENYLGSICLRSKKEVYRSLQQGLEHPVFKLLGEAPLLQLKEKLSRVCGGKLS